MVIYTLEASLGPISHCFKKYRKSILQLGWGFNLVLFSIVLSNTILYSFCAPTSWSQIYQLFICLPYFRSHWRNFAFLPTEPKALHLLSKFFTRTALPTPKLYLYCFNFFNVPFCGAYCIWDPGPHACQASSLQVKDKPEIFLK